MRVEFTNGALIASVAAGPIVAVPISIVGLLTAPRLTTAAEVGFVPLFVMLGTLIGFVIAIVPNMIGAGVLAWAGTRNSIFRHPMIWAATGFLLGGSISAVTFGHATGAHAVLGVVGMLCALICRWQTRWIAEGYAEKP